MKKEQITADGAINRYADMVYRLALSEMKNQADADDLFQEVFVRLVDHIQELQSWDHVKAWLLKVTVNCAKKHFEQYWNRNVSYIEDPEWMMEEKAGYVMPEESSVLTAVKRLPPKYRMVVHLFYFEQMSIAEIAKMTEQKDSTVKSQLFRAREMLKEILEGDPDLC